MMWAFLRWQHFKWGFVVLALMLAVTYSGFLEAQVAFKKARGAEIDVLREDMLTNKVQYLAEVQAIKNRLNTKGFTTFSQYVKDRDRLITLRERVEVVTRDSRPAISDSPLGSDPLFDIWWLSRSTLMDAGSQYQAAKIAEMECRRNSLVACTTPEEEEQVRQAMVTDYQVRWRYVAPDGKAFGGLGSMAGPVLGDLHGFKSKPPLHLLLHAAMLFYCFLIPLGIFSQIHELASNGYSVVEHVFGNLTLTGFFAIAWPCLGFYEAKTMARRTNQAWFSRVRGAFSEDRIREMGWIDWGRFKSLGDIRDRFEDVGIAIGRARSSRVQRVMVACSVLIAMFKPTMAQAQDVLEPAPIQQKQVEKTDGVSPSSDTASIGSETRWISKVDGESAIAVTVDGLSEPVVISLRNTNAQLNLRARYGSHEHDQYDADVVRLQPRFQVRYDTWKADLHLALPTSSTDKFGVKTASLSWCPSQVLGGSTTLGLGREFLPTLAAIPPPFGGMLDGALTDAAFDFFGDGVSVTLGIENFTLTARVFKPLDVSGIPDHWIIGSQFTFSELISLGAMVQAGSDPDEDWLISGEVTGKVGDLSYEFLGAYRERPTGLHVYGTHLFFSYPVAEKWTVAAQFDWLTSEELQGRNRIYTQYRTTVSVWYEPIPILRFQADIVGDWIRRGQHKSALEIVGGVRLRF